MSEMLCCDSGLSNSTLETKRVERGSYHFLMILVRQLLAVRIFLFNLTFPFDVHCCIC